MEANKSVLFVVNPVAGNRDKSDLIQLVKQSLQEKSFQFHSYTTTGHQDQEKIKKLLDKIKPDLVIVAGGDGTVGLVADLLLKSNIILGILPAGSANGLALNLDLPSTLAEQIEVATGPNTREIDTLSIDDKLCLHLADFGINAKLVKKHHESDLKGKMGYLYHTIPTLLDENPPFECKITTSEKTITSEGIFIVIANASRFGTGVNINPSGIIDDGKFEVLIFKSFDIPEIIRTLYDQVSLEADFVEHLQTNAATLECVQPVDFQIDGEYQGKIRKIEIKISHRSLKVAVPGDSPADDKA